MPTRGQLAREAAAMSNDIASHQQNEVITRKAVTPKTKSTGKATKNSTDVKLPTPAASDKKRKRFAPKKAGQVNGEVVMGGWDELPHNMGKIGSTDTKYVTRPENTAELSEPATKKGRKSKTSSKVEGKENTTEAIKDEDDSKDQELLPEEVKAEAIIPKKSTPRGKARKNAPITPESSAEIDDAITAEIRDEEDGKPQKKKRASKIKKVVKTEDVQEKVDDMVAAADKPTKKPKKEKKNKYGLTPGMTPFPDFPDPTPEVCQEVNDLLAGLHGEVKQPEKVPAPSLEVSGCGEVPSVLDAMIRTLLSAATSGTNSSRAFQGLINKYGKLEEGIGKGSVNWYKVHESPLSDVFEAIKSGGLAKTKSARIKDILNIVYEQNIKRRDAFIKEKESGASVEVPGGDVETQGQKDLEIAKANSNILSLDHLHALSAEDAMIELTKFPGIGVKTASCVILFCMQRPSFAVDTHVWRLCKWLKWVPEGAKRDQTFSHCEVRVPDHLKYPLHQLFIRHGKTCGRCRANTGTGSQDYIEADCPIDHLVTRTGKRKDESAPKGPPKKSGGRKKGDEWDSDEEQEEDIAADDEEDEEVSPDLSEDDKEE